MAKKKSTAKKVEDRSVRANMNALIGVSACVAIVLAIIIFFVNMIINLLNSSGTIQINAGRALGILNLIKDIALGVAVCLAAYYYARGKKQGFRILVFACIIIYIVMAVVGFAIAL